ncbi:hypothetical protein DKT69_05935 [Micromonospora sicca]|uniref:Uncharacterized protein n=1 Tax=Micromonospora sicca TaxID=2202420 RepID=A0A317DU95_9ACTN|nr:hypothetical protein [Micromonospora sp. 4G51]PWR16385.1 hypothetical protein DKT69_05935 [Micromonospora sp. 4G51]
MIPTGHQSARLRDLLVGLLIETGDPRDAVAERRAAFDKQPTIDNLRPLLATVAETDRDETPTEWALTVVRDRVAQQPGYLPHLIDALHHTGRDDEAWHTGLARLDELPTRQRVELLHRRQQGHPVDVREPYRALVNAHLLDSHDKRRYDTAITMLRHLRDAYAATGETDQFAKYLDELRGQHRRRPPFLAKLDAARLHPGR